MKPRPYTIECCRAGAIGDVLMATPAVRALRQNHPDALIRFVTVSPDLLLENPDIDELSPVNLDADRTIWFEYPIKNGYPDVPLTHHIAWEFARQNGIEIDDVAGTIRFTNSERMFARSLVQKFAPLPTATIHIKAGWSPYKEWPAENWQQVVDHFFGRMVFIQVGRKGEPELKNAVVMNGIMNLRLSAACVAETDLFIGIDSFPNHVAGALRKPAVVLFGSTSPAGSGYPTATNIWIGETCSPCYREYNTLSVHPKDPCPYDVICQKNISVEKVIHAIENVLSRRQVA